MTLRDRTNTQHGVWLDVSSFEAAGLVQLEAEYAGIEMRVSMAPAEARHVAASLLAHADRVLMAEGGQ